ncbi:MAG: CHAT domain-containing protein [Bacteroidota bacterium]
MRTLTRLLLGFLLSLPALTMNAQSHLLVEAVAAYDADDFERADSLLDLARPLYDVETQPDSVAYVQLYTGEVAYELGNADQAAASYIAAENTVLEYVDNPEELDFYYLILQGRMVSDEERKSEYRQALIDQVFTHQRDQPKAMADAYQSKAWQAWNRQEYHMLVPYLDTALMYAQGAYSSRDLGQLHANLSSAYFIPGDKERALINQQIANLLSGIPRERAFNLMHEGESLIDLRRFDAAAKRFDLAQKLIENNDLGGDVYRQLLCYRMQLNNELQEWDAFDINLEKLGQSLEAMDNPYLSSFYGLYFTYGASKAVRIKDYHAAEQWLDDYQKANIDGAFSATEYSYEFLRSKQETGFGEYQSAIDRLARVIASLEGIRENVDHLSWSPEQFYPEHESIVYLKDLISYYLRRYNDSNEEGDLESATTLLNLADQVIEKSRRINYQFANRLALNEVAKDLTDLRMAVYHTEYAKSEAPQWILNAFEASAGVKQRWVNDRHLDYSLRSELGVNREIVDREEKLQAEVSRQMRLAEGVEQLPDLKTLETIRLSVDSLRDEQQLLEAEIKRAFPRYAAERYRNPKIRLDSVRQNLLDENEVLIQFLEVDTAIYAIAISESDQHFAYLPLSKPLSERLPVLLDQLDDRDLGPDIFLELHALYEEIIAPLLPFVGKSNLLIIPDGYLWYVPFNGLITELAYSAPEHYFAHRYMVQDRRSRAHLNTILALLTDSDTIAALSPDEVFVYCPMGETQVEGFPALPMSVYTGELLQNQHNVPARQISMNEEATKAAFLDAHTDGRLFHFGTHAQINPENPEYSFMQMYADYNSDGRLYAYELSDMDADIELAVLMACRTADGKLYRGQGVANLGRDMMRGGAKGLLLNRWRISDDMSRRLMAGFYPALLDRGLSPSDALRETQLKLIDTEATAHPADWANLFYFGRNNVITLQQKSRLNPLYFSLGAVALALLSVFLGLRKKENQTRAN